MNCENCKACPGSGVVAFVPLFALLAFLGLGACAKHHRQHAGGGHEGCRCACHRGHDGHHGRECAHGHEGEHAHVEPAEHAHRHGPEFAFGRGPGRPRLDPKRILDKRFASGEIDEDEYQRRLQVLRENA